jgi:ABC-type cobalamin/Fe3+-siderophores transport system ATPase subunit
MLDGHALVERPTSAISCLDLSVRYGARRVLNGASLEIRPGLWTSVVGLNGCGKSTLLRTLAGLIAPSDDSHIPDGWVLGRRRMTRRLRVP